MWHLWGHSWLLALLGNRTRELWQKFCRLKCESESHSVVSSSMGPHGLYSPWNSPGQNTGVGSLSLLQRIFPIQGSNPCVLDSLPTEPHGKPKNTAVGSLSLLQQIFPAQELNWGLLHCRQILYQLSHKGSPYYLGGPNVIMSPEESESEIFKDITVLALKMEGAMSQRMWAASRNWKSQGNIFFPRATSQLHGHLDFSLANPCQNSDL